MQIPQDLVCVWHLAQHGASSRLRRMFVLLPGMHTVTSITTDLREDCYAHLSLPSIEGTVFSAVNNTITSKLASRISANVFRQCIAPTKCQNKPIGNVQALLSDNHSLWILRTQQSVFSRELVHKKIVWSNLVFHNVWPIFILQAFSWSPSNETSPLAYIGDYHDAGWGTFSVYLAASEASLMIKFNRIEG